MESRQLNKVPNITIPNEIKSQWKELLDTIAEVLNAPVALLTRLHEHEMEVVAKNTDPNNLYYEGQWITLSTDMDSGEDIEACAVLTVEDALKHPNWADNPGAGHGFCCYLGLPLFWPDGAVFGTVSVLDPSDRQYTDLERRILEQFAGSIQKDLAALCHNRALVESRKLRELLFNNAADAFFVHDIDGRMQYINRKACELFGYTEDELLKMKPWDLTAEEFRSLRPERISKIVENGEYCFRTVMCHRDGTRIPLELSATYVDREGGPAIFSIARPLASRLLPEEELHESERNLREAQRIGHVGNWSWDPANQQLQASEEVFSIFGYAAGSSLELVANFHKHFYESEVSGVFDDLAANLERKQPFQMDFRIITTGGNERYIFVRGEPVLNSAGEAVRFSGIVTDITDRKIRERELEESHNRFRDLIEDLGDNFVVFRYSYPEGIVMYVSPGARSVFGIDTEAAVGRNFLELIRWTPETLAMFEQTLPNLQPGDQVNDLEESFILPDGDTRVISVSAHVVSSAGSDAIHIDGIAEDITERKHIEIALKESEERFNLAMAATNEGIWDVDIVNNTVYYTPRWKEMLGYKENELPNTLDTWLNLIHPDEKQHIVEVVSQLQESTAEKFSFECRMLHKDGAWREIYTRGIIIRNEHGTAVRRIGTHQDITEQRQLEAQLRWSEQQLREAQRVAHIGSWSVELPTYRSFWSDESYRIMGFKPGEVEVSGELYLSCIHPEDRAFVTDVLDLSTPLVPEMEYRIVRKDGEVRHLRSLAEFVYNDDGDLIRLFGTMQDITDLRRIQKALEDSEQRFNLAMDATADGVWDIDLITHATYYSPRWKEMLGYADDELRNEYTVWQELVHPDELERINDYLGAVIDSKENRLTVDTRLRHKNGTYRNIRSRGVIVRNADGRAVRLAGTHTDLTEQFELEQALATSEQRLNLAVEATNAGVWDDDAQTGETYLSPKYKQLAGYTDDELENLMSTWISLIHPDDVARVQLEGEEIAANCTGNFRQEYRIRHKDGTVRHVQSDGRIIRNSDGVFVRAIGTIQDVTSRKELEDRLKIFQKLADASGQGFGIADMDHNIVYMNKTLYELRGGVSEADFIGKKFTGNYVPGMQDKIEAEVLPALRERGNWMGEMYAVAGDGAKIATVQNFFHIHDDCGTPQYIACIVTPIDDIKKKEEELKIFRQFADESGQGFAIGTMDGIAVYANRTMCDMLELETDDLIVGSYRAKVYINGVESLVNDTILPELLKSGQWTGETTQWTVSGKHLHTIENFFLIRDENGEPLYIGDVITPIDQMKEKEAQLQEARKAAEAASEAKSQFLANMSHEIRTPLNAIVGMSHLAMNTDVTPKQRHYLQNIDQAGRSLRDIISSVLDFSKMEAGKLRIVQESFRLEETVQQVVEMLVVDASEKDIDIHTNFDLNLPAYFIGDSVRLTQILNNLLHNAVKFTEQGEVQLSICPCTLENDEAGVEFVVRDTGIGMTESQTKKLFQVFSQVDSSVTRTYGGTGLGLAISKRLAELMGGTIEVDSIPMETTPFVVNVPSGVDLMSGEQFPDRITGHGSTFTLRLPLEVDAERGEATLLSEIPNTLRGKRVLIIDDSPIACDIASGLLANMGMEATLVNSGEAAIQYLNDSAGNSAAYDAILVDLEMDGMNGMELAKRFEEHGIPPPPTLLMTNVYWQNQIRPRAMESGFTGLIMKPIFPGHFAKVLHDALQGTKTSITRKKHLDMTPGIDTEIQGAVLLVEDNRINQEVVTELLKNMGLTVTLAQDGTEAVTMLRRRGFDLVMMDIQMPKMDGLTATRYIRGMDLAAAKNIPIIAMTAHALEGDREKCLEAGMNDYISKPIDPQHLSATLRKWLTNLQHLDGHSAEKKTVGESAPWIKKLEEHGIEAIHSLRQLGGNMEFYIRMLRQFTSEYVHIPERIAGFMKDHEMEKARDEVHSLKNVAGYIGATSMWNALGELNKALKDESAAAELALDNFASEMHSLVAVINNALRLLENGKS